MLVIVVVQAAMGILVYAQDHLNVVLKETW